MGLGGFVFSGEEVLVEGGAGLAGEGDEFRDAFAGEVEVFTEEGVAEMVVGEEAGEVLVGGEVGAEAGEGERIGVGGKLGMGFGEFEGGSDVGAEAEGLGGGVGSGGSVEAVVIGEGEGGLVELGDSLGEGFGVAAASEEGEGGVGEVFDEHGVGLFVMSDLLLGGWGWMDVVGLFQRRVAEDAE